MEKKVAIMQPYFFPYIGYFQLIHSVDEFIIYDNIQYTKKGWINRNRILDNDGSPRWVTLPLKKDSDYLNVVDRKIADTWDKDRKKTLGMIKTVYSKAPYFKEVYNLIEECLMFDEINLFSFIHNSIIKINSYIGIETPIIISSQVNIDHSLKSKDKVLAICKEQKATTYVNAIGGMELYDKEEFKQQGIELNFIQSRFIRYPQFIEDRFNPWLSIIDVLMFNGREPVKEFVSSYKLI